jgi:hypothetical protein
MMQIFATNIYLTFNGGNMANLLDIVEGLNTTITGIQALDLKLDDIRALIASLRAGTVTQEEIDALAAKVEELKVATAKVVTEANETV